MQQVPTAWNPEVLTKKRAEPLGLSLPSYPVFPFSDGVGVPPAIAQAAFSYFGGQMNDIITTKTITMSSREIADLVEKRHDNVKRTIEFLHRDGVIGLPHREEVQNHLNQKVVEYRIGKRDSLIVVAQLCPEFTARIVDRWQELEAAVAKPAIDLSNPAALRSLLLNYTEQVIALQQEVEAARPAVEFVGRYVEASGEKGFREVCKLLKANEARFREFLLDENIMYVLDGKLMPYAPHLNAGRFTIKTGVNEANGKAFTQAKFTTKGIEWIAGRWMAAVLEAA